MKKTYLKPLLEVHRMTTVLMSNTSVTYDPSESNDENYSGWSNRYSGSIWNNGSDEE